MSQKESEWEKSFEEKFPELWGSNDGREGYDSDVKSDVKSFIEETLSTREKEIAEEVEKAYKEKSSQLHGGYDDADYLNAYGMAIHDVLQLLKH